MSVLITGITGRIGANLAATLVDRGHAVRGLVWPRDPRIDKLNGLDVELVHGSLTNPRDVLAAVNGAEAVYHLGAAFQGGGPFSETDYFDINVRGTFNMLEAARAQDRPPRLVYAGTDAIYEKYVAGGLTEPIREDRTPRRCRGWYALSKSLGEELCTGYWHSYELSTVVLRFCMVFGAGEILDFPQFRLSGLKGRSEFTETRQSRERLVVLRDEKGRPYKKHVADVRDIVQGCRLAMDAKDVSGRTIQLAGPAPFSWDEAVPHLSERLGIPYVETRLTGNPTFYEFDLSRARKLLGFKPEYDIRRMIDDALAFRRGGDIGVLPTD
ncbi:MAG: NAD(P)-dependent oxidoreductase [Gemmatimonadota bacterium]|nr:NAD(P)-dependent oxidoreductase [Gemmatimonadota bacterium]